MVENNAEKTILRKEVMMKVVRESPVDVTKCVVYLKTENI